MFCRGSLVCLFVCQHVYSKKLLMNVREMFGESSLCDNSNRLDSMGLGSATRCRANVDLLSSSIVIIAIACITSDIKQDISRKSRFFVSPCI